MVTKVPVQCPEHWWCRGEGLKHLTAHECCATILIKLIPKPKKWEGCGQKGNNCHRFHPKHRLCASHGQFILSKQTTPIVNGCLPKHPGPPPPSVAPSDPVCIKDQKGEACDKWLVKANAFAFCVSTICLPHESLFGGEVPQSHKVDWSTMCAAIKKMEQRNLLIDRLQLAHIRRVVCGQRQICAKRTRLSNCRHRCTTHWCDVTKREAAMVFGEAANPREQKDLLEEFDDVTFFSSRHSWRMSSVTISSAPSTTVSPLPLHSLRKKPLERPGHLVTPLCLKCPWTVS